MEQFYWNVSPDMQVKVEPRVKKVAFGDGYQQRQKAGINHDLRVYSITIKVKREDEYALNDFLTRHGGYQAFLWREPHTHRNIKVVCPTWSSNVSNIVTTISATFEEVVA